MVFSSATAVAGLGFTLTAQRQSCSRLGWSLPAQVSGYHLSIFADDVILFPLSDTDLQLALDWLSTACEAEDRRS